MLTVFAASGAGEQARLRLRGQFGAGSAAELSGFYRLAGRVRRRKQRKKEEEEKDGDKEGRRKRSMK